jgi:hypothetical protein
VCLKVSCISSDHNSRHQLLPFQQQSCLFNSKRHSERAFSPPILLDRVVANYPQSLTAAFSLWNGVINHHRNSQFCTDDWVSKRLYETRNPFTAEVAIMRLLGSAPKSHLCDQRRRSKVNGLSDLNTLFIDLGCFICNQMQRAFNVFKNTLNWLKIDSVDQKINWLVWGNFSQDAGTPGTERVIAFSQLAVKGLNCIIIACIVYTFNCWHIFSVKDIFFF